MAVRVFALVLAMGFACPSAWSAPLSSMSQVEIAVLQQRLQDAGCYQGPVDGQATPAVEAAIKACPDQNPILRIETGSHTAGAQSVGTDRACTLAVTGSIDKTVRLWSLPEGRLIRTQRLPIGEQHYGEISAVAVSPDGRLIAASGTDAYSKEHDLLDFIYVFDSASGATLRRFGPASSIWNAFSPDGRFLAAAAEDVVVFEVATGREVMRDEDYDEGLPQAVVFGPAGTLFAAGYDGHVRRYSAGTFRRTAKVALSGRPRIQSVAVDYAGRRVAVSIRGAPRVEILDAANLRRVASADVRGVEKRDQLDQIGWFRNGRLVAGGYFQIPAPTARGGWKWAVRIWDADGRRVGSDRAVADDLITSIMRCGEDLYLTTGDPTLLRLGVNGTVTPLVRDPVISSTDKVGDAFTVSDDGTRVRLGLKHGSEEPVLFDLDKGTIVDSPRIPPDLKPADVTSLRITGWDQEKTPKLNGMPLAIDDQEEGRSLAIR